MEQCGVGGKEKTNRNDLYWDEGGNSPFHEVDHIDDARCTDHGLVSEDGPHGLFHTKLWLQGRQKWLNLLPKMDKKMSVSYVNDL